MWKVANDQSIGVARIFDWGGPNHKSQAMTLSEIFKKGNFLWDKDIVEWKIWSRSLLALNQDFGKGRGRSPQPLGDFCNFFEKKANLIPLDHISHVFTAIWKN